MTLLTRKFLLYPWTKNLLRKMMMVMIVLQDSPKMHHHHHHHSINNICTHRNHCQCHCHHQLKHHHHLNSQQIFSKMLQHTLTQPSALKSVSAKLCLYSCQGHCQGHCRHQLKHHLHLDSQQIGSKMFQVGPKTKIVCRQQTWRRPDSIAFA